ncbi:GMC family oxidoreductase [Gluconacetobacter diazotrophicus]|uniref:GMC family oxidoreductase n=1 Tax=Gluconacetobacter diazotrophicus TaxID=33996 RepID=UPI0038D0A3B0
MQGRVLRYTQAMVIGGGSSINAQIYIRGNAGDYDGWAREKGCEAWEYRRVLPYFKRAENNQRFLDDYHGAGGPLGVSMPAAPLPICEAYIKAAQELGIPYNHDFNGPRQAGIGFFQLTQRNHERSSASRAYLGAARGRKNLTVRLNAQVLRVVVEKGRAIGVELSFSGRTGFVRAEREVILCSGAIGSPKLLLQSGIGPADELCALDIPVMHDLPGVGRNLQDHLDLFVIAECRGDFTYDGVARPHRTLAAGLQYLIYRNGPAASSLFETGGFWYVDPRAAYPDLQFHLGLGSGIEAGVARLRNAGVTLNTAYLRPRSRGTVTLRSADPAAAPLIDPNYFSDPHDRTMSIEGLKIAREIILQPAMQDFVLAERLPGPAVRTDAELFDYACRNAKTDHHPVGTCRMGVGADAVVDPELRLHGIAGLRVCDASVMPKIPSCNTNSPTIMVGEKGADMILGRQPLAPAILDDQRNDIPQHARREVA